MINVNTNTKNAWLNNDPKTLRLLINNEEIDNHKVYSESIKMDESVCDDDSLHYKGCIPSRLELEIREIDPDIVGQSIQVYMKAGETTELILFSGFITSSSIDATKKKVKLIAYDKLYQINNMNVSEWYRTRVYPMTLKQFRDGFFSFLEMEQEEVTLCNDSMTIEETIGGEAIKGADILMAICEICGVFGCLSRDGQTFLYKSLAQTPVETISPSRTLFLDYEDFECKPINRLIVRADSDDIGAIVGTGTNTYIVEGNILAYGQDPTNLQAIADRLLSQIYGGSYVPTEAEIVGFPIYEAGDCIRYERPDGAYTTSYILSRKLKGIHSLHDEFKGQGCENYGNALQNSNDQLIQLRGQANRLTRTVEGVTQEVETIRDDYASKSELQQTSDSITAQIEYLQQEIDGSSTIYYTQEAPTLLNYPAWDFTYNIPCNNTVKLRDDLPFEYTESYYQKNVRALVYDEVGQMSYRFVKQNGVFGWVEVADTELGVVLQRLSSLELTTQGITAEVSEIQGNYVTSSQLDSKVEQTAQGITSTVSATYQTKNDAEFTRSSLQSQINQTAGEINLKVSKGGVVSEINQSPDTITLNSNRLVINSTNFELTADGEMTCRKGTFNGTVDIGGLYKTHIYGGGIDSDYAKIETMFVDNIAFPKNYVSGDYTMIDKFRVYTPNMNCDTIRGFKGTGQVSIIGGASISGGDIKIGGSTAYRVGFFGSNGSTRKTVRTATSSDIVTKFNDLINALSDYGLIAK